MAPGLMAAAQADSWDVVTTSRRSPLDTLAGNWVHLDLTDDDSIDQFDVGGFDHAILLAGITSISQCERDPALSQRVNVDSLSRLSQRLVNAGSRVTALSTSQVFSRYVDAPKPDDPRTPTCIYGHHKALLEDKILDHQGGAVIRLTKVVPPTFPLVSDWCKSLERGETVSAFSNVAIAPVVLDDVIADIWALVCAHLEGIAHISSRDQMSYAKLIEGIARAKGLIGRVEHVEAENDVINGVITGPYARLGLPSDSASGVLHTLDLDDWY